MNDPELEVPLVVMLPILLVAFAGITAFAMWIVRWLKLGYVLAYEPRRRPPWGPAAGLLAVLMTAMGIWNAIELRSAQSSAAEWTAEKFAHAQLTMSLIQLAFVVAIVGVLVIVNGASWRDLGLPTSSDQLIYDVTLGIWIALAAVVPIWLLQVVAIPLLGIPGEHPLLDQMQQTPDWGLFVAAMVTAMLAAPVFEEMIFRLLLQGGLERLEDETVGWQFSLPLQRSRPRHAVPEPESLADPAPGDEPLEAETAQAPGGESPQLAAGDELWAERLEPEDLPKLPPGGDGMAPGLNHGWAPILISSFVFALAHLGNGPSPIALFALALMLGYAYQRTHRILPCIVAHMVFNSISILLLILMLSHA